jgi:hypothetical protein
MRTEARIFNVVAAFLYVVTAVYAWWTSRGVRVDWTGTVALLLSATLCLMCGAYFAFVARRITPRPEDRDADVSEGAGPVGFFAPYSYWPPAIALAASVAALGVVFWQLWLFGLGMVGVLASVGGLLFEYYTGARRIEV